MRMPFTRPPRPSTDVANRQPNDGFGAPVQTTRPGTVATREESARVGFREATPQLANDFGSLARSGMRDVISDERARQIAAAGNGGGMTAGRDVNVGRAAGGVPEERTPQNLPAVISNAIREAGDKFNPRWHMVRHMPGYVQHQVRAIARPIFEQFTETPIEDIQTVTTATNSEYEVKMLMAWIAKHGRRDDEAEIDIGQVIPGYRADVQKWVTEEYSFLLVRDVHGHYVYGWPSEQDFVLDFDPPASLPGPGR